MVYRREAVGDRAGEEVGRERSGRRLQLAGIRLIYSSSRSRSRSGSRSRRKSRRKSRSRSRRKCGTSLRLANIWNYKGRRRRDLWAKRRDLRVRRYL